MANTSSRTLRLLSLLQHQRYWPGAALADRLGVSARTLRRDVDRLRELGYPVSAHRGVDGGYSLAPGAALPPLMVDDEEAVAVALGLRLAAHGAVSGIEQASLRALAKVAQVMPARLRRRVEALALVSMPVPWAGRPTFDATVLTVVAQACRDEERIRFGYTARGGAPSQRHVEPHRLVASGQRWYLVAYDLDRADWRSFRLDRIAAPVATRVRFRPRALPAEDAAAFVHAGVVTAPVPGYAVEAEVAAPAETVRADIGQWVVVEEIDERRCRVRVVTENLDWPAFALVGLGVEFRVLGPPELVAHARSWADRLIRATTAQAASSA